MKRITNNDVVIGTRTLARQKYTNDIHRYKPMTPKEEVVMFTKLREGDESVRDYIIKSNLKFVVTCAKRYEGCGVPLDDMISEGNFGLVYAVNKFDHTKGFKFISYAVNWIKQCILMSISKDSRTVTIPLDVARKITRVREALNKMEMLNGGYSDLDELAKEIEVSPDTVNISIKNHTPIPLDRPLDSDEKSTYGDRLIDEDDVYAKMFDHEYVEFLFSRLTNTEQDVLKRLYGFPPYLHEHPLAEMGRVHRSRNYTINTHKRALDKIKATVGLPIQEKIGKLKRVA